MMTMMMISMFGEKKKKKKKKYESDSNDNDKGGSKQRKHEMKRGCDCTPKQGGSVDDSNLGDGVDDSDSNQDPILPAT